MHAIKPKGFWFQKEMYLLYEQNFWLEKVFVALFYFLETDKVGIRKTSFIPEI